MLATASAAPGAAAELAAAVAEPFALSYHQQENGAIVAVGNSQMSCPSSESACTFARTGAGASTKNDSWTMQLVDADVDSSTSNSTNARLIIPANATVLYALLTWGGRSTAGNGGEAAVGDRQQVRFRTPTGGYSVVRADWVRSPQLPAAEGEPYYAAADVTDRVKAGGSGTYWAADLAAATGRDRYAGWSLTVVYRDPALPLRDLRVYQGFADLRPTAAGGDQITIPIDGILTPADGAVNAQVGVVAWEGDRAISGERIRLGGVALTDVNRPADNVLNSSVTTPGGRRPQDANTFGVDVGLLSATGALGNNVRSTQLELESDADAFYATQVISQIDLLAPAFNPMSMSVTNSRNLEQITLYTQQHYTVSYTNTGADHADNAVIKVVMPSELSVNQFSLSYLYTYDSATRELSIPVGSGAAKGRGGSIAPEATVTAQFDASLAAVPATGEVSLQSALHYTARAAAVQAVYTGNRVTTPTGHPNNVSLTANISSYRDSVVNGYLGISLGVGDSLENATIEAVLPPQPEKMTLSRVPSGFDCVINERRLKCSVTNLAANSSNNIGFTGKLPSNWDDPIEHQLISAWVTTGSKDNPRVVAVLATGLSPIAYAKLRVKPSQAPSVAVQGVPVTFPTVITNDGPAIARRAVMQHYLPAEFEILDTSGPAGACEVRGTRTTCPLGDLPPGVSATVQVRGVLKEPTTSRLQATASAFSDTTSGLGANTWDNHPITHQRAVDLAVSVVDRPASLPAGSAATFVVDVTAPGGSSGAPVRFDFIHRGMLIEAFGVSTMGTCLPQVDRVLCELPALAEGSSARITIRGTVENRPGRTVQFMATSGAAPYRDYNPNDNYVSWPVTVGPATGEPNPPVPAPTDLAVAVTAPSGELIAPTPTQVHATVRNLGSATAENVRVAAILPVGVQASPPDSCQVVQRQVTCAVEVLPAGGEVDFAIDLAVGADAPVGSTEFVAWVGSQQPDPNSANNRDSATVTITAHADVETVVRYDFGLRAAENPGNFTVTVTNRGPSVATGLRIKTSLAGRISPGYGSYLQSLGGRCDQIECTSFPPIPVGGTITARIPVHLEWGATANDSLTATATVVGDQNPANNAASAAVGELQSAGDGRAMFLPISDTVTAGALAPLYAFVANQGPAELKGGRLQVAAPPDSGWAVTASCDSDANPATATCGAPTRPNGGARWVSASLAIPADAPAGTVLTPTAEYLPTVEDPVLENNKTSRTLTVVTAADLTVDYSVQGDQQAVGEDTTFVATVTNRGPSTARGVQLSGTIPDGTSFVAGDGECARVGATDTIGCQLGDLQPGAAVTVMVKYRLGATAGGRTVKSSVAVSSAPPTGEPTADPVSDNNNASAEIEVGYRADLQIDNQLADAQLGAGEHARYLLTLTNDGPSDAPQPFVTNVLPAGTRFVSATASGDGTCEYTDAVLPAEPGQQQLPLRQVDCAWDTIGPGQAFTVDLVLGVDATQTAGTVITNTATAGSAVLDPTPPVASAKGTVVVLADVRVSSELISGTVHAGGPVRWQSTLTNDGPTSARSVTHTFTVPDGVQVVGEPLTADGVCAVNGREIACDISDIGPNGQAMIVVAGQLASDYSADDLSATATVSSSTEDTDLGNNKATVRSMVGRSADLTIAARSATDSFIAGLPAKWVLTVTNHGPSDAVDVVVTDDLPATAAQGTATTAGGDCATSNGQVKCALAGVKVGRPVEIIVTAPIPADNPAQAVRTAAEVSSATPDPVRTNDNHLTVTPVTARSDLHVVRENPGSVAAGQVLDWTVTATNAGPSDATNVTIVETVPTGIVNLSGTGPLGVCAVRGPALTCAGGTLAAGKSAVFRLTGTVSAQHLADDVLFSASGTSGTPDPVLGNNTSASTVTITPRAELSVVGHVDSEVVAGKPLLWHLTVTNGGPSAAQSVVLKHAVPQGITEVAVGDKACQIADGALGCEWAWLPPGDTNIALSGELAAGHPGRYLAGEVSVSSATPDTEQKDNSYSFETYIQRHADVKVATRVASESPAAGRELTLISTVTNDGPSDAPIVIVAGTLPTELTAVEVASDSAPCTTSGVEFTCLVSDLKDGAAAVVTVTGTVSPAQVEVMQSSVQALSVIPDPMQANDSSTVQIDADVAADIAVDLVGPKVLEAGATETASVRVTNAGPAVARGVRLSAAVPPGLVDVRLALDGKECDPGDCALPDLAVGQSLELTATGKVPADTDMTEVSTKVLVSSSTPDINTDNNTDPIFAEIVRSVKPTVRLETSDEVLVPGVGVELLATVGNAGISDAQMSVSWPIPSGMLVQEGKIVASQGDCDLDERVLSCDLGSVPAGKHATIAVGVMIDPALNTPNIRQHITVLELGGQTAEAAITSTVTAAARLVLTQQAPESVAAGEPVQWTISVSHRGPSMAQDVTVRATLPDGLQEVVVTPGVGSCDLAQRTLTCMLGAVAPHASDGATVTISARVDPAHAAAELVNVVELLSPTAEPAAETASAAAAQGAATQAAVPGQESRVSTATTALRQVADVETFKSAIESKAAAGQTLAWDVTVRNNGPSLARQVVMKDLFPEGLTAQTVNAEGQVDCADGECAIGDLPVGSTREVRVAVQAETAPSASGGLIVNRAQATQTPDIDPTPGNNLAAATVELVPSADLAVNARQSTAQWAPGASVTYLIEVIQHGPSDARGVLVGVRLPSALVKVAVDAVDSEDLRCVADDRLIRCTAESLAPNSNHLITVRAEVDRAAAAGGVATDVTVVSQTDDPQPTNNTNSIESAVLQDVSDSSSPPLHPSSSAPPTRDPSASASPTSAPTPTMPSTTASPTMLSTTAAPTMPSSTTPSSTTSESNPAAGRANPRPLSTIPPTSLPPLAGVVATTEPTSSSAVGSAVPVPSRTESAAPVPGDGSLDSARPPASQLSSPAESAPGSAADATVVTAQVGPPAAQGSASLVSTSDTWRIIIAWILLAIGVVGAWRLCGSRLTSQR